jgi:hypothetical protein
VIEPSSPVGEVVNDVYVEETRTTLGVAAISEIGIPAGHGSPIQGKLKIPVDSRHEL